MNSLLLVGLGLLFAENPVRRQVAVTFDDLPGVAVLRSQRCRAAAYAEMNQKLIRSVNAHRVPALGLVVESRMCGGRDRALHAILEMWLDAGLELGNHSYSHFDLNTTELSRYQADVVRGEAATRKALEKRGEKLKYFRHPFLHAGKDPETKRKFEAFLKSRDYTVAPVTIDNQEWIFAEVYAMALERGDTLVARRVAADYLRYMETIFDFFEKRSVEVLGYEIRQILLLHVNPLNADYFNQLAEIMKKRGYSFISVGEALKDPAYRLPDRYAGPVGLSWIHRWGLTRGIEVRQEPREPQIIAKLFRDYSNTRRLD